MSADENSNKKSGSSLLILLLVFAAIVGASWFYFSNKESETKDTQQELADQITEEVNDQEVDEHDHAGHDHGHDHSHDHGHKATNDSDVIGIKGKIQELNPPAIYGERGVGNPDAPIKIQEFFSLTCNHCADFHKGPYQEIKKNLIDTGKVYFVYEEFPLNGPALYGSMIARCLPEERYAGFIDILLRTQDQWAFSGDFKTSLMQNAKLAGMSEEEFEACFNNEELQKALAENIKKVSEIWQVSSTPSFVINNGERILLGSQPYETFEKLVDQLMAESANTETEPSPVEEAQETEETTEAVEDVIEENTETMNDNKPE